MPEKIFRAVFRKKTREKNCFLNNFSGEGGKKIFPEQFFEKKKTRKKFSFGQFFEEIREKENIFGEIGENGG